VLREQKAFFTLSSAKRWVQDEPKHDTEDVIWCWFVVENEHFRGRYRV